MAAIPLLDRLGLNERERKLVVILAGVLAAMVFLALPFGVEAWIHTRRDAVDELRTTIASVQGARAAVRERQAKRDSILQRYQKKAPPLAGYLEQSAAAQKVQVVDSSDRPDVPIGKRYSERSTTVHLKKVGMLPFAKFLEAMERSGFAVSLSRLNIRKRTGEPDQYDVEVGLSAFDRSEAKAESKEDEKEKAP